MKTKSLKKAGSRMLAALALIIGIGLFSNAKACTATFTYTTGANGLVNFTSTVSGFTTPSYWWNPGDGSGFLYGANPSHTYLANGTYYVLLTVTDSICTDTITLPVTVTNVTNPCLIKPSFTVSYGTHGNVTFTSTSTGTTVNTVYFWDPADGTGRVSGTTVFNHKYIYKGNYNVCLTLQDTTNSSCIDSTWVNINVSNADSNSPGCNLHANFTYTLGPNGNVSFTSTTTGSAWSFTWNPGDASGATTNYSGVYNHAYLANGTYTVTLFVNSDSSFCTDSISIPVTISNVTLPCTLSANFNIAYDSNGQVKFTSTSTGTYPSTQYYWNPGDGSGTVLWYDTLTHKYPFIGNYTATLYIKDTGTAYCFDSISYPVNIYNRDSLVASFTYVADSITAGMYRFTSTSQGTNANTYYKWTPGDGNPSDSGLGMTTYTHTYSVNGPYSATLTIWYTIIPKVNSRLYTTGRYSLSSYTKVIYVTTVTGIASLTDVSGKCNLYPNPNKGEFRINITNLAQDQKAEVDITNLLGEVVTKIPAEVTNNTLNKDIDLQNTPAGIYFVKVITSDKVYTTKLIIER
jgi:PKD repeat protein